MNNTRLIVAFLFLIVRLAHGEQGNTSALLLSSHNHKSTVLRTAASRNGCSERSLVAKNDNTPQQNTDAGDFWERYPRLTAACDLAVTIVVTETFVLPMIGFAGQNSRAPISLLTKGFRAMYGLGALRVLLL